MSDGLASAGLKVAYSLDERT